MSKPAQSARVDIPLIARFAEVIQRAAPAGDAPAGEPAADPSLIDICWTTGATVQRAYYDWYDDEMVEYTEELLVSPNSVRLERLNSGAPFLDSHRSWGGLESVLGSVVPGSVKLEGGKGYAQIRLTAAPGSADSIQKITEGTIRFVSVGYLVHEYQITKKDGQRDEWVAVDWEPYEISAVAMPADAGAAIRADQPEGRRAHSSCLITRQDSNAAQSAPQKGPKMPPKNDPAGVADDQTRAAPASTEPAPAPAPAPAAAPAAGPTVAEARAAAFADSKVVTDLCARHGLPGTFGTDLLAQGRSVDQIRAAILDKLAEGDVRTGRNGEPTFATARSGETANELAYRQGVENALMHRTNPRVVLTEQGRGFRGMSLMDLARDALERSGIQHRGMGKMEIAQMALAGRAAGLHGTTDFPSILANVATNTLRAAYDSTPRTFTLWARGTTLPDFKPAQRSQLGGAPDLLRVPESGEFSYGTMGEGKETYQLTTYGRVIGLTRQAIINDQLEAFTRIPQAFGASAADLESDLVYLILSTNAALNDGVALFHATHGNLGTAADITEASLAEAYRLFASMRGIEGRLISIQPKYLLTPPGTRAVAAKKQIAATTPTKPSDVNAFAGLLDVIIEPRLIPSSGADPWYMVAEPGRIDTVEYAHLEGTNGIFTETRYGFEVDGVEIKARHDFAAKAIDYRGMVKNAGV